MVLEFSACHATLSCLFFSVLYFTLYFCLFFVGYRLYEHVLFIGGCRRFASEIIAMSPAVAPVPPLRRPSRFSLRPTRPPPFLRGHLSRRLIKILSSRILCIKPLLENPPERDNPLLGAFGANKSRFSQRSLITVESIEFDREYNDRCIRCSVIDKKRLSFLKGKTNVSIDGRDLVFPFPVRDESSFRAFLSVNRSTFGVLRSATVRGAVSLIVLESFLVPYSVRRHSAHVVEFGSYGSIVVDVNGVRVPGVAIHNLSGAYTFIKPLIADGPSSAEVYAFWALAAGLFWLLFAVIQYVFSLKNGDFRLFTFILTSLLTLFILGLSNTVSAVLFYGYGDLFGMIHIVFAEEAFKSYTGLALPLAELAGRLSCHTGTIYSALLYFLPFAMHCGTLYLPFPLRVFVHFLWNMHSSVVYPVVNNFLPATFSLGPSVIGGAIQVDDFFRSKQTVVTARLLLLLRTVLDGDFGSLLASLVAFEWMPSLTSFLEGVCDPSEFVAAFIATFSEGEQITLTAAGASAKRDKISGLVAALKTLLPKWLSSSPSLMASVTLGITLVGSSLLGTFDNLVAYLGLVTFPELTAPEALANVLICVSTLFRSVRAAIEAGSLSAFFLKPDAYVRQSKIDAFVAEDPTADTYEAYKEKGKALLEMLAHSNEPSSSHQIASLLRAADKRFSAKSADLRREVTAWMVAEPGEGGMMALYDKGISLEQRLANDADFSSLGSTVRTRLVSLIQDVRFSASEREFILLLSLSPASSADQLRLSEDFARCALSLPPPSAQRASSQASAWRDRGDATAVVEVYQKLLSSSPDSAQSLDAASKEALRLLSEPACPAALLRPLKDLSARFKNEKYANQERAPPFVVVLVGSPGSGKTMVMDSLKELWVQAGHKPFTFAEQASLDVTSKFPLPTASQECRVLILNDATGNHAEDLKTDKVNLGTLFQTLLDTTPFAPNQASVERKGMAFPNVELIFVTTNEYQFVFSQNEERLQRRFDKNAIILEMEVVENDRVVKFDVYDQWSPLRRSAGASARIMRAALFEKRMTFTRLDDRWHPQGSALNHVYERMSYKSSADALDREFRNNKCECGVVRSLHFGPDGWSAIVPGVCRESDSSMLTAGPKRCPCGLPSGEYTHFAFHPCNLARSSARTSLTLTADYVTIATVACATLFFQYWFRTLVDRLLVESANMRLAIALASERVADSVDMGVVAVERIVDAPTVARAKARLMVRAAARFIRDNAVLLGGAALMAMVASVASRKSSHPTARFIDKNLVDRKALEFGPVYHEPSYPTALANAWQKDPFPMQRVSLATPGVEPRHMTDAVSCNIVKFAIITSSHEMHGHLLFVTSNCALVCRHYFEDKASLVERDLTFLGSVYKVGLRDIQPVAGHTDVLLVRLSQLFAFRSIVRYFPETVGPTRGSFTVLRSIQPNGVGDIAVHSLPSSPAGFGGLTWMATKKAPEGECGLPAILETTKGPVVVGIVSFRLADRFSGNEDQGGNVFTRGDVEAALRNFDEPHVLTLTYSDQLPPLQQELPANSQFRNVRTNRLQVLGSTGLGREKFKSSFKKTKLFDDLSARLSKPYSWPLRVKGVVDTPEGPQFRSSFLHAMTPLESIGKIDPDAASRAVDVYSNYFIRGVVEAIGSVTLAPLSMFESLFGCPAQGIAPVNWKSSVGPEFKYFGDRSGIFTREGNHEVPDPAFVAAVRSCEQQLIDGFVKAPTVVGSHKDEIRPKAKLDNFEIRLFFVVDLVTNTLARMYLAPLCQILLDHPYLSKAFGKLDAGSPEWSELHDYIAKGKYLLDLDFAKFDASHQAEMMRAVARFFYRLARAFYKDETAAEVVYRLVLGLTTQIFSFSGDFALKTQGLPSGHIITLMFNCVANIILMLMAFEVLCPGKDFFAEVFSAVVGDDNISGISARAADFNLVNIQRLYALWGYKVTDSSKRSDVRPFITWDEAQFVKRRFVWSGELGQWLGPLDRDSIWKSLCFWSAKKTDAVTYEQRMVACLQSVEREAFLQGREFYAEFKSIIDPLSKRDGYGVTLAEYEFLRGLYGKKEESFMSWGL